MGQWRGKDGKIYNSLLDKNVADVAWDKQRAEQNKQIELLNKQNDLLIQNRDAENRRIEEIRHLEKEKMENENEMRLLNLSDKIGISKIYYDSFASYLEESFDNAFDENLYDLMDELDNLDEAITEIENGADYTNIDYCKEYIEVPKENDKTKNIKAQIEKLKDELSDFKDENNTQPKARKWKYICIVSGIISFVFLILSFIDDNTNLYDTDIYFFLVMIGYIVTVFSLFKYSLLNRNNPDSIKKDIETLERSLKHEEDSLKKEKVINIDKLKEKREKIDDSIVAIRKKINARNEKIVEEFINFRKEHYNSDIEKYLLDMGLKELFHEYDIKYTIVNNKNKIKEGTIEDYIDYFSDFV